MTDSALLFSDLGITSVTISQSGTSTVWGGTQGNDTSVSVTVNRSGGQPPLTFAATLNWVSSSCNGNGCDYIGLTFSDTVNDGYPSLPAGFFKTYILQFNSSPISLSSLLPDNIDGSANFGPGAFAALNNLTGDGVAPTVTASQSFNYAENQVAGAVVGTVAATDNTAVTAFRFSATGTNTSADGYYTIDNTGKISITAAGVAAGVANNDFEINPNQFTYGIQAGDAAGNWSTATNITLNVTDVDDTPPVLTGPSNGAGAAASSITVNENQTGVTQMTASENVTWAIVGGNDQGKFQIAPDGTITFVAAPDFEAPTDSDTNNSYVLTVEATDAQGNKVTQQVTVNVANVDDTAPVLTGPSGGAGAATSTITVNENQTGVTQMTASESVTWAIVGGNDQGKFQIAPDGTITFVAAPDFEAPTDSDTNNSYVLTVEATDAQGNKVTQQVTVNVANVDDAAPVLTGPSGGAGAAASTITVNENQTAVTKMLADESVTWAIVGGNDQGKFQIAPDGTITFVAAPDFEAPTDSDTNNSYVLTVEATDAQGNKVTQQVTVNVANLDDAAPLITGPSGPAGSAASAITVNENQTAVTKLVADETVTWAIVGGNDQGKFQIAPDGTITFVAAPDFEAPADNDTNNTYVLTVEATDAAGNKVQQTITVTIANLDDAAPVITGPSGGAGAAASAITVNENQTGVTKMIADESVTWSITGGNDQGKFQIAADGTITFVAAPDYEAPTDSDTNNSYVLQVTATDAAGNRSVQTVTVNVADLDDAAPIITGPSGGAGAAASTITVNENQTGVTRVTANEAVTWSITGGNDQGKFQIAADGTITFVAAPDFEAPTDSDTNNSYILTITATDAAGNRSVQTITVNVANIDDTAPLITGPSGGAGAAASALTINEGLTAVTTFTANETVTWSIDGGSDAAKFQINAQTGAITFLSAPDFEAPTDSDRNNTYVVRVKAVDAAGNISYQTLTVTIVNVDEIARKLSEIGGKLRSGLRQYAAKGLSDMLSFNEGLMQNGDDDVCAAPGNQKALSGALNASEAGGTAKLDYSKQLTDCSRNYRIFFDVGLTYSKFGDGWNARQYASTRFEAKLDEDFVLGVGLLASKSNDQIAGFDDSSISDGSVQMNLYGRYKFTPELRTGAFFGLGRAWYDFGLTEADGFVLDGKMTGKRSIYGWMLSGDINVGDMVVTTDAVVSHATEKLGNAKLAAQYRGESRSGIDFEVGTVNVTRISIPASAPIKLSGDENGIGGWSKLVISPGLLCEDNGVTSNSLTCGYQIGAKFVSQQSVRDRFYGDFQWESVSGMRRSMFAVGYAYRFGKDNKMELGLELQNGNSGLAARDSKALLSVRLAR